MLEFSLKQEQIKNGKIMENPEAEIKNLNQFEVTESDLNLAKERAKRHREMLKKYLYGVTI